MISNRSRTLIIWLTTLVSPAAFAGGLEKDPKGESRKDPEKKTEATQGQRAEVSNLKRQQLLMRLRLKAQLDELKLKDSPEDAAASAAKPRVRKQKPKQIIKVKPKVLAKVVGGNAHEVKAVGMDGEVRRIEAEFNHSFESFVTEVGDLYEHLQMRGRYSDLGTDVLSRLSKEERDQNKKDIAELEREALEKIGDMPEIEYFISQSPAERREAMRSPEVLSSVENIRRWRQVAIWDPSAEVRVAALGRLQRAGEGLALRYIVALKPYEAKVFEGVDPYDSSARDYLRGLVRHEVGNEAVRRVAQTLLYQFPVAREGLGSDDPDSEGKNEVNWVTQVEAGENPEIIPTPEDFMKGVIAASNAKALEENTAVAASPYADILKPFPEAVRRELVAYDPATLTGHLKLRVIQNEDNRLAEVAGAYQPELVEAAKALLDAHPLPKLGNDLHGRAWKFLLAHDLEDSTFDTFTEIDFSSKARAQAMLQKRIVDFSKSYSDLTSMLSVMLIETVLNKPQAGTGKALMLAEMSTMNIWHMKVFAKYLRIADKAELLGALRRERERHHLYLEEEESLDRVIRALEQEK